MSRGWNISLFHYRNHGADYGRVLVGMQVPPRDKRKFRAFLARVGYPCQEEIAQSRLPIVSWLATDGRCAARGQPRRSRS